MFILPYEDVPLGVYVPSSYLHACQVRVTYCRWLRSLLLLYLRYVFWTLIHFLVCWSYHMCLFTWWNMHLLPKPTPAYGTHKTAQSERESSDQPCTFLLFQRLLLFLLLHSQGQFSLLCLGGQLPGADGGWWGNWGGLLHTRENETDFNPLNATSCKISRLKCACTCLQNSVFSGLITNLPSVYCAFWWKHVHLLMRNIKQKGLTISYFALLLVLLKWHGREKPIKVRNLKSRILQTIL